MESGNFTKTILFIDIVDSVDFFAVTGDIEATYEIQAIISRWAKAVTDANGVVVKNLGDGILCLFDRMEDACESLATIKRFHNSRNLIPHAGLHTGEVLVQDNDVFGQAINLAARLSSFAAPGEFVASREAIDAMPERLRAQTRFLSSVTPKGFAQPMSVYQFTCDDNNQTTLSAIIPRPRSKNLTLTLSFAGEQVHIDSQTLKFSIGREDANDLHITAGMVSRQHATIRFMTDQYSLIDHSTNGTWLVPEIGDMWLLMRQSRTLQGRGHILLGAHPDQGLKNAIQYQVHTS